MKKIIFALSIFVLGAFTASAGDRDGLVPRFDTASNDLELRRLAQPNTYFDKAGRRFAVLGNESGTFEAWAYPLKLIRNFEFSFLLGSSTQAVLGKDIVRFISVTPAATTLTYAFQSFTMRATFVTAIEDPGAVILLAVDTTEPVTVVCSFLPVLQPMWPAGLGGQYASWDVGLRAYLISEPTRKNHGYIGSPAAQGISYTPAHMLSDSRINSRSRSRTRTRSKGNSFRSSWPAARESATTSERSMRSSLPTPNLFIAPRRIIIAACGRIRSGSKRRKGKSTWRSSGPRSLTIT